MDERKGEIINGRTRRGAYLMRIRWEGKGVRSIFVVRGIVDGSQE